MTARRVVTEDEFDRAVKLVKRLFDKDRVVKDMADCRKGDIAAGIRAATFIDEADPRTFLIDNVNLAVSEALEGDVIADAACRITLGYVWRNEIEVPNVLTNFAITAIMKDRPNAGRVANARNPDIVARDKFIIWAIVTVTACTTLKPTRNRESLSKHSACDAVAKALKNEKPNWALQYAKIEKIWSGRTYSNLASVETKLDTSG